MRRSRRSRFASFVFLAPLVALPGCADPHERGLGVPAPGEPAAIVLSGVSWAGGHVHKEETRVDSSTMQYRYRWCEGADLGADCTLDQHVTTGAAYLPSARELFRLAASSAFRALRSEYPDLSRVVPPDPHNGWLDVTANGRYRRISWSNGAQLPDVISRMTCAMLSARGSLVLCD